MGQRDDDQGRAGRLLEQQAILGDKFRLSRDIAAFAETECDRLADQLAQLSMNIVARFDASFVPDRRVSFVDGPQKMPPLQRPVTDAKIPFIVPPFVLEWRVGRVGESGLASVGVCTPWSDLSNERAAP